MIKKIFILALLALLPTGIAMGAVVGFDWWLTGFEKFEYYREIFVFGWAVAWLTLALNMKASLNLNLKT